MERMHDGRWVTEPVDGACAATAAHLDKAPATGKVPEHLPVPEPTCAWCYAPCYVGVHVRMASEASYRTYGHVTEQAR